MDFISASIIIIFIVIYKKKTFDKIDFAVVQEKTKKLGIRRKLFNWNRSFLTDRTQTNVLKSFPEFPRGQSLYLCYSSPY